MNGNSNKEKKDFLGDIADALRHTGNTKAIGCRRTSSTFRLNKSALIIGGLGVVLLIIFLPLLLGRDDELSREDYHSIRIGLSQLEKRLTHLEGMEERVAFLEQREKAPGASCPQRYTVPESRKAPGCRIGSLGGKWLT